MENNSIDSFTIAFSFHDFSYFYAVVRAHAKHLSLGKRGCPENPSADWTAPGAYEKHVPIRSGKQTTYALSEPKGNAVKDQHRNDNQPTPRLFQYSKIKRPLLSQSSR
jgi:hypothetical protein